MTLAAAHPEALAAWGIVTLAYALCSRLAFAKLRRMWAESLDADNRISVALMGTGYVLASMFLVALGWLLATMDCTHV